MSLLVGAPAFSRRRARSLPIDVLEGAVAAWYAADASGAAQPDRVASYDGTASGATLGSNIWTFDGADDYINFTDILNSVFGGADKKFSVSFRGACDTTGASQTILGKLGDTNHGENTRQFVLRFNSGRLEFLWYHNAGSGGFARIVGTTPTSYGDGAEREYTLTYDGALDGNDGQDRVKFYANGAATGTTLTYSGGSLGNMVTTTARLSIGACIGAAGSTAAYDLDGSFRRLAVYDSIIDSDKIAALAAESL